MKRSIALAAMCMLIFCVGCGEESPHAAPAPAKEVASVQPEYALESKSSDTQPKNFTVVWTATVPTGGWKLTTDSVLIEDSMGKTEARIWATLEQPGPDETVTQAFETLTGTHDAGAKRIDQAELSIRRHIRGIKYDTPELYAIVKRAAS